MAQILVRDLPDDVKEKLRRNAKANGRSLEAEVRDVLTKVEPAASVERVVKSGKRLAQLLVEQSRQSPVPDDIWDEFQANLNRVRRNSRARPVDLDQ